MIVAYALGFLWFILITYQLLYDPNSQREDNFFVSNGIFGYDSLTDAIVMKVNEDEWMALVYFYFILTSLSTVGFGDFAPISDFERPLGAMLLLVGVLIFSYFMNEFVEILDKFLSLDAEYEESEQLERFWTAMEKFNMFSKLEPEFVDKVNNFLHYNWRYNKNNCLRGEVEEYLFDQLPAET